MLQSSIRGYFYAGNCWNPIKDVTRGAWVSCIGVKIKNINTDLNHRTGTYGYTKSVVNVFTFYSNRLKNSWKVLTGKVTI